MVRVLFQKAQIPGGATRDLFAAPVVVEGHTRGASYVAPYLAIRHKAPPRCPFCGGAERVEIGDMWTDHNFTIDACCEGMHELVTREMAADPEWGTEFLRELGAEHLGGRDLRRVAYTDEGSVLLDWQPEVRPISRAEANDFIARWHRHNKRLQGDTFRAGIWNGNTLLGVVVVWFPTAQAYMPAYQRKDLIEVRRLCIRSDLPRELTWKTASALYKHAADEAERRGFRKIITYTLKEEEGMSLRYARWKPEAETRGGSWGRPSRPRKDTAPTSPKVRWFKTLHPSASIPSRYQRVLAS